MAKPNCYDCQYRREIPGDAHTRCEHPYVKPNPNPFGALIDTMGGKNQEAAQKLNIKGNEIGIRKGWFMWPANFDPVWLESCTGFTPKKQKTAD